MKFVKTNVVWNERYSEANFGTWVYFKRKYTASKTMLTAFKKITNTGS